MRQVTNITPRLSCHGDKKTLLSKFAYILHCTRLIKKVAEKKKRKTKKKRKKFKTSFSIIILVENYVQNFASWGYIMHTYNPTNCRKSTYGLYALQFEEKNHFHNVRNRLRISNHYICYIVYLIPKYFVALVYHTWQRGHILYRNGQKYDEKYCFRHLFSCRENTITFTIKTARCDASYKRNVFIRRNFHGKITIRAECSIYGRKRALFIRQAPGGSMLKRRLQGRTENWAS